MNHLDLLRNAMLACSERIDRLQGKSGTDHYFPIFRFPILEIETMSNRRVSPARAGRPKNSSK